MDTPSRKSRRLGGFTLTELAIVLGIVGAVLSAIWVASAQVSDRNKAQKATAEVMQIVSGYRSLYAQHGVDGAAAGNDVTCIGVQAGYFPAEMITSTCVSGNGNTYPLSPWGGIVGVVSFPASGAVNFPANTILVAFYNLPQDACIRLANSLFASPDLNFETINLYAQPIARHTPWPLTAAAGQPSINSYCGSGSSSTVEAGFPAQ